MIQKKILALFFIFLFFTIGCASLQPGYETPVVTITSFEAIPGNGVLPRFKIGLHIVNPNRTSLDLKGVAYTIALEGHKIITGVSNTLPHIDSYSEGDVELNASVDLFSSIGFFSDMIRNQKRQTFAYSFNAKLDAGTFHPIIKVSREGTFSLSGKAP
ncbi:MAG: LEA type 2 family protein [Pseudomonadota bacterium]